MNLEDQPPPPEPPPDDAPARQSAVALPFLRSRRCSASAAESSIFIRSWAARPCPRAPLRLRKCFRSSSSTFRGSRRCWPDSVWSSFRQHLAPQTPRLSPWSRPGVGLDRLSSDEGPRLRGSLRGGGLGRRPVVVATPLHRGQHHPGCWPWGKRLAWLSAPRSDTASPASGLLDRRQFGIDFSLADAVNEDVSLFQLCWGSVAHPAHPLRGVVPRLPLSLRLGNHLFRFRSLPSGRLSLQNAASRT